MTTERRTSPEAWAEMKRQAAEAVRRILRPEAAGDVEMVPTRPDDLPPAA